MVMPDTARVSLSRSLIRYVSQHGTREGLEGPLLTALVFLKEHGFMSDYTEGVDCWNQLSPPRPPSGNVIFYDSLGQSLGALPPSAFGDTRDASSMVSSALGRDDIGQALIEQNINERFSMVGSSGPTCQQWVTAACAVAGAIGGLNVGAVGGAAAGGLPGLIGGAGLGAAAGASGGKDFGDAIGPIACEWVSNDTAAAASAEPQTDEPPPDEPAPDEPPTDEPAPDEPQDTPQDQDDDQKCDFPPDTEMPPPDDSGGGGNPVAVLATFSLLSKAQAASLTSTLFQNAVHVNDLPQSIGNIAAAATLGSLGLAVPNFAATTPVDAASLVALASARIVDRGVLARVPVYNQNLSSAGL
jgi:hypothetical protein